MASLFFYFLASLMTLVVFLVSFSKGYSAGYNQAVIDLTLEDDDGDEGDEDEYEWPPREEDVETHSVEVN